LANSWDHVVGTGPYERTLRRAEEHARKNGWTLNPDIERVQKVVGLMTMNHTSAGEYFCPCKQSHPLDIGQDTVCPCPEMNIEIAEDGYCFCRLFYKIQQS